MNKDDENIEPITAPNIEEETKPDNPTPNTSDAGNIENSTINIDNIMTTSNEDSSKQTTPQQVVQESSQIESTTEQAPTEPAYLDSPKNILTQMRLARFGKIATNIVITCAILTLIASLSTILLPLIQILAIVITFIIGILCSIFTLGAVYAIPDNPMGKLWDFLGSLVNMTDATMNVSNICFKAIPYLTIIGITLSIIGIVIFAIDKHKRNIPRIVALSILIVLLAIALVFYYLISGPGGTLWQ